ELRDVLDVEGRADAPLRVEAAEPVGLGRERHVVPGGQVLDLDPRRQVGGEPARKAGRLELLAGVAQLGPRGRRLGGIEARLLERVLVEVEHRPRDRKSTRLNSSHVASSYAVFCLKKKNNGQGKLISFAGDKH